MFPGFWQPSLCGGPGLWKEPMPEHGGDGEKQIVWSLLGSWLHTVEAEPQLSPSVGRCFWRQPLSWRDWPSVCLLQPIRTECLLSSSAWQPSGWSAQAMTSVWAGCARAVGTCLAATFSHPGLPACSILPSAEPLLPATSHLTVEFEIELLVILKVEWFLSI